MGLKEDIVKVLREDGVVACPTETVFGFMARAYSEKGVKKIFEIKKRDQLKTLPVFVKDVSSALELLEKVPDYAVRLMERFWPGPMTLVGYASRKAPTLCVSHEGKIGIRIPDSDLILEVLREMGEPLASTSCNLSGEPPLQTSQEVREIFGDMVDLIVEGRSGNIPSTVIDITYDKPVITRKGVITFSEIEAVIDREVLFGDKLPILIVFLCTGNTCRSPMAEALFKRMLEGHENITVISRGTIQVADRNINPLAKEVLKELRISDFPHIPKKISEVELEMADIVIAMAKEHIQAIPEKFRGKVRLLDPKGHDVEDPIGEGIETYRLVRDKILNLLESYWKGYFLRKFENRG